MSTQQQPASFAYDEISEAAVAREIALYPPGKQASAVKTLLDIAQRQIGRETGIAWLPRAAMDVVAARIGIAPIRVYEIATFYTMFNRAPVGKYLLQACTTTPCWLQGSDDIVSACKKATGIVALGQTSVDGMFTLVEAECLGACVNAPILQINDDYYEDLNAERATALLEKLKAGEALPPPGSTLGRMASAPITGLTSLLPEPGPAE